MTNETTPAGDEGGAVKAAFERCAAICEARAEYFDRAKGYREWDDAARSYRATAREIREARTLTTPAPKQIAEAVAPSPAETGEAVAVKALEWVADRYQEFEYRSETAKTSIGKYEAFSFIAAGKPVAGWTSTLSTQEGKSASLDEAKAAAQADYEQRIRSALAHPPADIAALRGRVAKGR